MRQDQLLELLKTSPNGKKVYVTNNYSDTVSVVDTETDTQTGAISDRIAGGTPLRAAFSRDGIKAYVVNYGSVLVINAEMDASEGTVPRKNTRSALREEMDPRATRTHTSPRKATGGERAVNGRNCRSRSARRGLFPSSLEQPHPHGFYHCGAPRMDAQLVSDIHDVIINGRFRTLQYH